MGLLIQNTIQLVLLVVITNIRLKLVKMSNINSLLSLMNNLMINSKISPTLPFITTRKKLPIEDK
jgi:hypothetical protein